MLAPLVEPEASNTDTFPLLHLLDLVSSEPLLSTISQVGVSMVPCHLGGRVANEARPHTTMDRRDRVA